MGGFGDDAAEGVGDERCAPEFESLAGGGLAADVAGFESDAVYDCHVDSVGDGVGALDRAPGVVLSDSEFGFLGGVPADSRRVEKYRCALQGGWGRRLRARMAPAA